MAKFARLTFIVVALVGMTSSCSDDANVGAGVDTQGGGSGNLSIGEETTTTAAPSITVATTAPPRATSTTAAPTTTAAPQTTTSTTARVAAATTTTVARDTAFVIGINSDNSDKPQFDPPSAAVAVGSVVRWMNNDTVVRSVIAQSGAFRSPEIPPGGSFSYKATQAGEFNYQDGTRPYAVGRLEVR